MKRLLFLPLVLGSALAFGCGEAVRSGNSPAASSTPKSKPPATQAENISAEQKVAPEATPVDEKGLHDDFAGTTGKTEKSNVLDGAALLKAVRTGQQENFDRIVFEFAGDELPSYYVEYVNKPIQGCGEGNTIPLKGNAWLEIRFNQANAHTEAGEPTIKNRETAADQKLVKELKMTCDFEAEVTWVAGLASRNNYRVLELKNPTRLVVDIKH